MYPAGKVRDSAQAVSEDSSFDDMVKATCNRLWDKKVEYSIRRIDEMRQTLDGIDKELTEFLDCRQSSTFP
jgi:hypothetical protein